ncbi:hypothetical protein ACQPZJ_36850 [Actinoplanes sp. CA-054009]
MKRFALLAAVLLVSACGSPDSSSADPGVASVASAARPSSAAPATRPQLRLDTSDEERQRLFTAYDDCLVAHGVKVNPVDQPGPAGPVRRLDQSGEPKAAYVACAGKLPLQPPELDEDLNPKFAAQWNDNVRCLRAHGLMVHVTVPGEWTYDDGDVPLPPNQSQIEDACVLEAFGAGK